MHYLQKQMDNFVNEVREMVEDHYEKHFSVLEKTSGSSKSVYGFVRKDDGAILKAATWKAPQTKTKSAVRGYITDDNRINTCTPYGIVYVR